MELSTYLQILARRKWLVITAGMAAMVIAILVGVLTPPTYAASAMLRAIPSASASSSYAYLNYADRNLNTLSKIATSSPVLAKVREKLGLASAHPIDVEVEVIPDSELFQVTVKDQDPVLAANAANVLASLLVEERTIEDISLYVAEPAAVPESPSILTRILHAAIAFTIGTGAGVGIAFVVENLDTRVYATADLKALTGCAVLAEIPTCRERQSAGFLVDRRVYYRDVFRRLRANIQVMAGDPPPRVLLLTSSEPEEGKSTIAASLARSLADAGQSIALVDADLRCPTLHELFALPNEIGLSQVLGQGMDLSSTIQKTCFERIEVLTSGPDLPTAGELLASDRMKGVIGQLAQGFNVVLLDAPAIEVTADAIALAPVAEGIVLVARSGWVKRATLLAACQQLANLGIAPIGIVVNQTGRAVPSHYQKYYREPDHDLPEASPAAAPPTATPEDRSEGEKKEPGHPTRDRQKQSGSRKGKAPVPELQEDSRGVI